MNPTLESGAATAAVTTHEVFNQATPLADVNLFSANKPLQDALAHHHPGYDREHFHALGAEAGSSALQQHARLANVHTPQLHTHDRFGRRVDQVEFHPSYHALLGSALRHGLHGTPWAGKAGSHVERAAAFMLVTEAEPSVLCPVSMTYAVTPALRGTRVVDALMHELQPARGQHAAFDAEVEHLVQSVDGVADEAQARRLARSLALVLQAAQLQRTSPDFVFDAFCASRFGGERATVFGLLPATTDFDSIVSRAMPH